MMNTINSRMLLEQLQADVRGILLKTQQLQHLPHTVLTLQPGSGKWSVAQVLEHLNIYARHYIAAIEQKLHLHQTKPAVFFSPGWLGNFFTKLMKPEDDQRIGKKMKSPKNAIPSAQPDADQALAEFIQHQHHLLNLLHIANAASLEQLRIPTSLSKFISLKLGDTFRFFVAHEVRHFVQISNTLSMQNLSLKTIA